MECRVDCHSLLVTLTRPSLVTEIVSLQAVTCGTISTYLLKIVVERDLFSRAVEVVMNHF